MIFNFSHHNNNVIVIRLIIYIPSFSDFFSCKKNNKHNSRVELYETKNTEKETESGET